MFEPFTACTKCGGKHFVEGPRGGASINVFCATCDARFNVFVLPPIPGDFPQPWEVFHKRLDEGRVFIVE